MATETLEDRLATVENELAQIKRLLSAEKPQPSAGWEKIFGTFADSEGFDEAVRLGREYCESQGSEDDVVAARSADRMDKGNKEL